MSDNGEELIPEEKKTAMNEHKNKMMENIVILMFEFVGTFFMTNLWCTGGNFNIFLGFFVVLLMGAAISGAHFNPIVTFAFMIRKDAAKFERSLGVFYMIF